MAYPLCSARRFCFVLYQPRLLTPVGSNYANTKPPVIQFRRYANGYSGPPSPSQILLQPEENEEGSGPKDTVHGSRYAATAYKMFEAAATTFATLAVLGYVRHLCQYASAYKVQRCPTRRVIVNVYQTPYLSRL